MNIILEGPDNTGKSTLALAISKATGLTIKDKEGRPPTQILLYEKFRKYEALDGWIIDRHPIISQAIYGLVRKDPEIPEEFMNNFFNRADLIIYCRALRTDPLSDHEASDTDDEAHLQMIENQYGRILGIYDNWAINCAQIIYTQYAQTDSVVAMVKGVISL